MKPFDARERAMKLFGATTCNKGSQVDQVRQAIEEATDHERERCAREAEAVAKGRGTRLTSDAFFSDGANIAAGRIRDLGRKPEPERTREHVLQPESASRLKAVEEVVEHFARDIHERMERGKGPGDYGWMHTWLTLFTQAVTGNDMINVRVTTGLRLMGKLQDQPAHDDEQSVGLGALREHLRKHYLAGIECDHEAKTDQASCACSMVRFPVLPSVGAAVESWIDHVLEGVTEAKRSM